MTKDREQRWKSYLVLMDGSSALCAGQYSEPRSIAPGPEVHPQAPALALEPGPADEGLLTFMLRPRDVLSSPGPTVSEQTSMVHGQAEESRENFRIGSCVNEGATISTSFLDSAL